MQVAEESETKDWTAGDLAAHCDWLKEKGYLKDATANAQRVAVGKVFEYVEGDGWESTNIEDLNVEDLLERFAMLARRDLKGQSLTTYQGRFKRALESYRSYMADPAGFRPSVRQRNTSESQSTESKGHGRARSAKAEAVSTKPDVGNDDAKLITYPFPVRDGVLAEVKLPADLHPEEAERMAGFLKSLAIKLPLGLPAGQDS